MPQHIVVIVQGAWGSSAAWEPIANRLRGCGFGVHVPNLSGLGKRRHMFHGGINLDTHVSDVAGMVNAEQLDRFVLVAHSYGGMIATVLAEVMHERIASTLFLDAFLPTDGKLVFDLLGPEATCANIAAAGAFGGIGVPPPDRHAARVPSEMLRHLTTRSPQPIATMIQRPRLSNAIGRIQRRLYAPAQINQAPVFARAAAHAQATGWALRPLEDGHMLHLEMPEAVASLIAKVVEANDT